MPFKQLLSGVAELSANELLQWDSDYQIYLAPLAGRSLGFTLLPFDLTIHLYFNTTRIDISLPESVSIGLSESDIEAEESPCDCHLTIHISALSELSNTNQLTRLIKEDKLDIEGDLAVAQHLSALVNHLDIDLTEILTHKIGDVPAHTLMGTASSIKDYVTYIKRHAEITLGEALIEEKRLVASPLALAHFSDEVTHTRYWCDRLFARIQRLEQAQQQEIK